MAAPRPPLANSRLMHHLGWEAREAPQPLRTEGSSD